MTSVLELPRPDDWHVHFRDGEALRDVVPHTARQFGRALAMPNLRPPVTTVAAAKAYRERILAAVPAGVDFQPLMALYLTDGTRPEEIRAAAASGVVVAAKLYPAGATTHSDAGVSSLDRISHVLAAMEDADLVLCVHGESTDPEVDVFDRERVFLEASLAPLRARFPGLRIVLEHATTREAVDFVRGAGPRTAASITAHHLLYDRNAMFRGGLRPHAYCLPVLKRRLHREALVAAATGGDPRFFLGTDSAPHARGAKEAACGCAGCFTAPHALELYAVAFERAGALPRLGAFAAHHGADFYGVPRNTATVRLVREALEVPPELPFAGERIVPFPAGESIAWRLAP